MFVSTNGLTLERHLESADFAIIKSKFCAGVPLNELKLHLESYLSTNSDEKSQLRILNSTVLNSSVLEYPPDVSGNYQRKFLKLIINFLEKQNADPVCDKIYELIGNLMRDQTGAGGEADHGSFDEKSSFASYFLSKDSFQDVVIISHNRGRMVADATTGYFIWPGGFCLTDYAIENRELFKNKKILEIGCGVGLCGIVTVKICCPSFYLFTDSCDSGVLENCRRNCKLNISPSTGDLEGDTLPENVAIRKFDWTRPEEDIVLSHWDFIIASEIVYDDEDISPIVTLFSAFITATPQTEIIVSCVERSQVFNRFLTAINDTNLLKFDELSLPNDNGIFFYDRNGVRMLRITKR